MFITLVGGLGSIILGAVILGTALAFVHLAMREHPPLVTVNPFADLELPKIEPQPVEFLEHAEADALYAAVEEIAGPGMRTLTELGTQAGLRFGELAGLHGHRVDWLRAKIQVVDVMTRGGLRQWPRARSRTGPCPFRRASWRACRCS
jgi:site-specific recombinase XerC